jgi:hypothetical protein
MLQRLAEGVWRWAARHPEWHRNDGWAHEVGCYAVRAGGLTLLLDPLVLDEAGWQELDGVVSGDVETLITIPYHVRSAEAARARYGGSSWGHPAVAKRLADSSALRAMRPGEPLPAGASAHRIGNPVRYEMPVFVPEVSALLFGDAVVGTERGIRLWVTQRLTPDRQRWYDERLLPSLCPLLALEADAILVTHGPPVVSGGRAALREAFSMPPFYHGP